MANAKYPYVGDFKYLDEQGFPKCPGDDVCPGPCDETCPIIAYRTSRELYQSGDYDKSLDLVRKAIVRIPDEKYPAAWCLHGCICLCRQSWRDANNSFQQSYVLDRGHSEPLLGGIVATINMGKFDEALEICRKYVQDFGSDEDVEHLRQVAETEKQKAAEAKKE